MSDEDDESNVRNYYGENDHFIAERTNIQRTKVDKCNWPNQGAICVDGLEKIEFALALRDIRLEDFTSYDFQVSFAIFLFIFQPHRYSFNSFNFIFNSFRFTLQIKIFWNLKL